MFCLRVFFRPAVVLAFAIVFHAITVKPASVQAATKNPFDGVKYWAYQLKSMDAKTQKRIARSPFDLIVIDYAKGVAAPLTPLTRREVAAMKTKPDGSRRMIIAYLSIGEAEDYRYYWPKQWNARGGRPSWLRNESKEWKGNYLVRYWDKKWQNIIFGTPKSYVDRIIKAGFDGFYIDRADAYYRFGDTPQARNRMSDFVIRLSRYIRSKQPGAAIMLQNAEELLTNKKFINAIDAIAKEDLLFGISYVETANKRDDIEWSTDLLEGARKKGKRIFVVEYLEKQANISKARTYARKRDYVFYYGPRGLFEIRESVVPGWTPPTSTGIASARASTRADANLPSSTNKAVTRVSIASAAPENTVACEALITNALSDGTIKFRSASSRLARTSYATLNKISTAVKQCRDAKVEIGGHTDSDGAAKRNMRLSRRRADIVRLYLTRKGVPKGRLLAVGYGQTKPIVPNDSPHNKARNRRIEFKVVP